MKYAMYKMTFPNGIHIGSGKLSTADITVRADTLFSAMCIESLNIGGGSMLKELTDAASSGNLVISDALPYINDTIYIPKPMCRIAGDSRDTSLKKHFKKLEYIPWDMLDKYLAGGISPETENDKFSELGKRRLYQKVSIKNDDNELYSVNVYNFNTGCGLYTAVCFKDEKTETLTDTIMTSLQFSGLGGKRSAGYGRFKYKKLPLPFEDLMICKGNRFMTISSCMAEDAALEAALDGASYRLIRRSGFVLSDTYSDEPLKKRDFYLFAAGAVFKNTFKGDVFDVSIKGSHPVYKYAEPMFINIGGAV